MAAALQRLRHDLPPRPVVLHFFVDLCGVKLRRQRTQRGQHFLFGLRCRALRADVLGTGPKKVEKPGSVVETPLFPNAETCLSQQQVQMGLIEVVHVAGFSPALHNHRVELIKLVHRGDNNNQFATGFDHASYALQGSPRGGDVLEHVREDDDICGGRGPDARHVSGIPHHAMTRGFVS